MMTKGLASFAVVELSAGELAKRVVVTLRGRSGRLDAELAGVPQDASVSARAVGFVAEPLEEQLQLADVRRDCEGGRCTLRATVLSSVREGRSVVVESGSSLAVVDVRDGRGEYVQRLARPDDPGAAPRILGIVVSSP